MIAIQVLFAATLAFAFPLLVGVAWFCEAQFRRETAEKTPTESGTLKIL